MVNEWLILMEVVMFRKNDLEMGWVLLWVSFFFWMLCGFDSLVGFFCNCCLEEFRWKEG